MFITLVIAYGIGSLVCTLLLIAVCMAHGRTWLRNNDKSDYTNAQRPSTRTNGAETGSFIGKPVADDLVGDHLTMPSAPAATPTEPPNASSS